MPAIRPLGPELQEAAIKELGEEPSRIDKDLEHIKAWLNKQPHLTPRTDDQFLVSFLRGCKYSLERTKEKLDSYYTMRTALPEYFSRRDPMLPDVQEVLRLGVFLPLPETDAEGRRVIIMRSGVYDAARVNVLSMLKVNYMLADIIMQEDDAAMVKGTVSLMDMSGVTMAHVLQMQPALIKKSMTCFQEGYPVRPKGAHHLHLPPFCEAVFNLVKSFMKEKLQKRVFVHGDDLESVYKYIPKKILPKEYGGEGPSVDNIAATWKKKVESYRDFLLEDEKFVANEKKRPGRPKTQEDLFGLEGSFRQLTVD